MKKRLQKLAAVLFVCTLALINLGKGGASLNVEAAKKQCTSYAGYNVGEQDYSLYARTVKSYLEVTSDTQFMRVQEGAVDSAYLVEYYDTEYNILSTKTIEEELPIFGGFYSMESHYYILSGQNNEEENEEVECFRITKYDKNWNRISSVGLYDCNTTVPFDAGSARFTECGKYLLIRTAHEMYTSSDGYNHQANVTIQVDTETMNITDSYTQVMNNDYGYVSHSFNQFIGMDGNHIVAVDHGDAYPRSLVLMKYKTDVTTGSFTPWYYNKCEVIDLLEIQGATGDNVTGASIGGFEISETSYLTAFNSIDQENGTLSDKTRNIYVAVCNKADSAVTLRQITNFEEGETTTTTPHLVKISDHEFMVLWSRGEQVYYVKIDGEGELLGEVCYMDAANLSDCVPVIADDQLVWYTWDKEEITFYGIYLSDITKTSKTVIRNGHEWELIYPSSGSNVCVRDCINCDYSEEITVPTAFGVYWNTDGGNNYSSWLDCQRTIGDSLKFWIIISDEEVDNEEFVVNVSDENVAELTHRNGDDSGSILCKKGGSFTITIAPKYNPQLVKTVNITVFDPNPTQIPTETEEVTPIPTETEAMNPSPTIDVKKVFSDVYEDWYTEYVQYVYDHGLMTGIKGTTQFQPNANITKAQVAQVLYNMEEKPIVNDWRIFTELKDVYQGEWYANAVAWAYNTGVVTGDTNEKKFFPNADVTREQLALMLYRYAEYKGYDTTKTSDFAEFVNADKVSDWSINGVKWAVGSGMISGIEKNGTKDLAPQGNATRAQVAAILKRFFESYGK